MLQDSEVGEEFLPQQWLRQNKGVPNVYFELLESSFTFLGPNELPTASEDVEEGETFVGRSRDKHVQCGDAPRELLDFFPSPRGLYVEDGLDFLQVRLNSSLTHHEV